MARKSKNMPNEDVAAYFMIEVGQTWSPPLKTLIAVSLLKESGLPIQVGSSAPALAPQRLWRGPGLFTARPATWYCRSCMGLRPTRHGRPLPLSINMLS
ncbi:unnamed protein product [Pylaiella littoralis]